MSGQALLRVSGILPLILLGLAGAIVPSEFWRSWGELTIVFDNDRLGGPFLPVFLATLFAYSTWSRFLILRVVGYLANLAAGLVLLLISAMMALVTAVGGPDARAESMPPTGVPLVFLVMVLLSAACLIALMIAAAMERREHRQFPPFMTRGEKAVIAILFCLAVGGMWRRMVLDTRQREQQLELDKSERSMRQKAEAEARRKADQEAPKRDPAR